MTFGVDANWVVLAVALAAATVNGGIGYGFSSITVPVALIFYTGRVLNPALVVVELLVNLTALIINRKALPRVWGSVRPLLVGAVPGIAIGAWVLSVGPPSFLRLSTYALLLPLIVLQSAGIRRSVKAGPIASGGLGAGIGALYAATTISGPPLALLFNNQGLSKDDFRAALSLFRVFESTLTFVAYLCLGLLSRESFGLAINLSPAVLVGIPLGFYLFRRVERETFRRICMVLDAVLVSYGLSRAAIGVGLMPSVAYAGIAMVVVLEAELLRRYLRKIGAIASRIGVGGGAEVAVRATYSQPPLSR